jgi:hypothetical protein
MESIFEEFLILYENNNSDDSPVGNLFLFQFNEDDPIQEIDVFNHCDKNY